jgi:hypothetical protein
MLSIGNKSSESFEIALEMEKEKEKDSPNNSKKTIFVTKLKLNLNDLDSSSEDDCEFTSKQAKNGHSYCLSPLQLAPVHKNTPLAAIPEELNVLFFNDPVDKVLANTRPQLFSGLFPSKTAKHS